MNKTKLIQKIVMPVCGFMMMNSAAWANQTPAGDAAFDLAQQWAEITYHMSGEAQQDALHSLTEQSDSLVLEHGDDADLLTWNGIINATYAGTKGGMGALPLVKKAKSSLEEAIAIDPAALDGGAYTTLGLLYDKVPGRPIAFGDSKKAEANLKAALAIQPDNLDANYFYADYLKGQDRLEEAREHLLVAQALPVRESYAFADQELKKKVDELLAEVNAAL